MIIKSWEFSIQTAGYCDIHDLTPFAAGKVAESGISQGQAHFFAAGSTAGITTVEYEPGLIKDLKAFFERIIPQGAYYHHEETWQDGNGFSHVRASLLKPSIIVPVMDARLVLGTWQQVILVDFDNRSRRRKVILQVLGL